MRAAIEKQRAAIEIQKGAAARQAAFAAKYRLSAPMILTRSFERASADPPPCPPLPEETLGPLLASASKKSGVAANLLRAVARRESAFYPCAVSPKGAQGLMQLMPATASDLAVRDPFDPEENMHAGARYLKDLLARFGGDLKLALAAYNAGPASVAAAGGVPDIPETRNYVDAILQSVNGAQAAGGAPTPPQPPASPASPPRPPGP
jgi:soluble lytic murein transglycosylase-like protein